MMTTWHERHSSFLTIMSNLSTTSFSLVWLPIVLASYCSPYTNCMDVILTRKTRYEWEQHVLNLCLCLVSTLWFPPPQEITQEKRDETEYMKNFERTGGQTAIHIPVLLQKQGFTNLVEDCEECATCWELVSWLSSFFALFCRSPKSTEGNWLISLGKHIILVLAHRAANILFMMNNIHTVWTGFCLEMNAHTLKILI